MIYLYNPFQLLSFNSLAVDYIEIERCTGIMVFVGKNYLNKNFRTILYLNTFAASYLNIQGLNNSCLKSPASTLVDLTFQSRALRSFSLNQLHNLSL